LVKVKEKKAREGNSTHSSKGGKIQKLFRKFVSKKKEG